MKTFVITVSKNFLSTHPLKGHPTGFKQKILEQNKIHTIRGNYKYWKNIVRQVNAGKAILSLREWSGKPYKSKQEEICQYKKLGIQKVKLKKNKQGDKATVDIDGKKTTNYLFIVANYDGFENPQDFIDWFPKEFKGCVIHFTDFRY